jgi:hypothetical protein
LLDARAGVCRIEVPGLEGWEQVRSLEAARLTFEAMQRAEPIISQGVLWNPVDQTYGAADLLVRSDILRELFPEAIHEDEVDRGAPGIGLIRRHYRVIDVKFKNLPLLKDGQAAAEVKDYMVQVHSYNQALGRIQGLVPGAAYLLGRGWRQNGDRSDSCLDRLAVCHANRVISGIPIASTATAAAAWIRRLRADGAAWDVLPRPSVYELWPNGTGNGWGTAYRQIREETEDVANLWQVGKAKRPIAHANGIFGWKDPAFTPDKVGIFGPWPARSRWSARSTWRPTATRSPRDHPPRRRRVGPRGRRVLRGLEWTGDINDDFSRMPLKGGDDVIFMIGCGHMEDGDWKFECFVGDDLSDEAEGRIIDRWFAHMAAVTARRAPGTDPLVFHWSHAEESVFSTQWNSAMERHPEKQWPRPNWYDFLNRVMKQEPVVVRGAMAFGLKAVARAMQSHGLIETLWGDSVTDGLNAVVAAWRCAEQASERGCTLSDIPLMDEIRAYNEVDCKVMMEIIRCLRGRAAVSPGG